MQPDGKAFRGQLVKFVCNSVNRLTGTITRHAPFNRNHSTSGTSLLFQMHMARTFKQ